MSARSQRRRLIRHHLPLALGSVLALVVFMTFPAFDPQRYSQAEMTGSPLPRSAGVPVDHQPMQSAPTDHGAARAPSTGHGAQPSASGHGSAQAAATGHGTDQMPTSEDAAASVSQDRAHRARETTATGYVATGLLALTLLIGPVNLLLRRRNPVSSYLRRDVGMWTAAFSVVHVIFGLQVHGSGDLSGFFSYFFLADGAPLVNSFGLGNWTGLLATVIVVGLLTISSDLALRMLKADRWKWLQRLNYVLFALVVAHAIFYGALVRATSPFTEVLVLSVIAVLTGQVIGIWLRRRGHRIARAAAA